MNESSVFKVFEFWCTYKVKLCSCILADTQEGSVSQRLGQAMDGNEVGDAIAIGPHRHHNFVPWQIHRQVLLVTTLAALILTIVFLAISKPHIKPN